MPYELFKVRWIVGKYGSTEEMYSFHISSDDVGKFIRQIGELQKTYSDIKYKTEGATSKVLHANGKLYDEVKKARDQKQFGIWKKPGTFVLHQPMY